jgi:ligand-binding sensor domain-containing protein
MADNNFRNLVLNAGHIVAGILIIAVIILVLQAALGYVQVKSTPPGWEIIRPPAEVSTLLIVDDVVWTGGKEGVLIINRSTGNRVSIPGSAPPFGYVRQIIQDHNGGIWVGHDSGLACYQNGSWQVIVPAPGVPFSKVLSIAERRDGTLVIGTETDVLSFSGGRWTSLLGINTPSIVSADVLFEDREANLWVGCGSPTHGGLYRLNGSSWSTFSVNDSLPHSSVRAITQTRDGTLWVATGFSRHGGAARYSGGTWTNLTLQDGLAGESTRSAFEDNTGRMWIGSEYDGIATGSPGAWKILTEKDGLAGNEVKVMVQDMDGTYWLGTNGGLTRIRAGVLVG